MVIAVVGDCTLDIGIRPYGPMIPGGDTPARITLGAGGQAANVAVRLARRGIPARLVAPIADDAVGQLVRALLAAERVDVCGLPAARAAAVAIVIDDGGERTMLSDRVPVSGDLGAALRGAGWVHVSGYVLRDEAEAALVAAALDALRPRPRISIGGGSVSSGSALAAVAAVRRAVGGIGPDLLIVDRDEAAALAGRHGSDLADAAAAVAAGVVEHATVAVVTGGAAGSAAAGAGIQTPFTVPAAAPDDRVTDTTGAGDAYAAALLGELSGGSWPPDAAAVRSAMIAASRLGALVTAVSGAQGRVADEPEQ